MANLFALCRIDDNLVVKHVRVTQPVQAKIEGIFQGQAGAFLDDVTEEIEFGGDWKPDADEVLVMDLPEEAGVITAALAANIATLPVIEAANFMGEGIKALFTQNNQGQILIQVFTARQILARRFSLMLDGDTFKELTEPAFTLDNYVAAIIEDGKLKFKSFFIVKRIFALHQFYQQASDPEIVEFCAHEGLQVVDVEAFKGFADEAIRKLVHAITKTHVLDQYAVDDIAAKANSLGLNIAVDQGKIVMPTDRKGTKQLLRFLDDGIYEASLSAKRYITNSKRLLG
jgi:hypothetical protein